MTTGVTKWNYGRCQRSREVVDVTRRGHKTPPLVLNPLQYAHLTQLAAVDEEKGGIPQRHPVHNPGQRHPGHPHDQLPVDDKLPVKYETVSDGEKHGYEYDVQHDKVKMTKSELSETSSDILSDYLHREQDQAHRKNEKSDLVNATGCSPKIVEKMTPGKTPTITSKPSTSTSSISKPSISNSKPSISTNSNTAVDYHFPGLEHTPEMKQLMALRAQLHVMKEQVGG